MTDHHRDKGKGGWLVFAGFSVLYLLTLSNNLGVTHDSVSYAGQILGGEYLFHPNHLLYQPVLALFVRAAGFIGLAPDITTISIAGAISGAAVLGLSFQVLRAVYGVRVTLALPAILAAGGSYGIWYYSVGIEIYIFPLLCLTACFYVLAAKPKTARWIITASILHSAALLFHQLSIFFALVPILALLTAKDLSRAAGWRLLAVYVGTGTVLVLGTYLAVAQALGHTSSFAQLSNWFLGYGTETVYWSPAGPVALLLAAVGWGRAVIGGHFAFGSPTLQPILEGLFPSNSLEDEAFLVRDLPGWLIDGLIGVSVLCGILIFGLLVIAVRNILKSEAWSGSNAPVSLLFVWLVPFVLFFIFWNAQNADFWITQTLLLWLILAVLLDRGGSGRLGPGLYAGLAAGLLLVNGIGTVLPATNPANDFYSVRVKQLTKDAVPNSLIVMADRWPEGSYITFLTSHDYVGIARNMREKTPQLAAEEIRKAAAGRRIYLWPDIQSVRRETKIAYGAGVEAYIAEMLPVLCPAGVKPQSSNGPAVALCAP